MTYSYETATQEIIKAGNRLDRQNFTPATSGNYSLRINDNEMAITVSGVHKGQLKPDQIMRADLNGSALDGNKPSAETLLHCQIYRLYPDINAVLHTHSIACTALTRIMSKDNMLKLSGYEMLKALPSIDTHDACIELPIFENTQDIKELSMRVDKYLTDHIDTPAYLIRDHGLYGWGKDIAEAQRVIEAVEMMLCVELHTKQIK